MMNKILAISIISIFSLTNLTLLPAVALDLNNTQIEPCTIPGLPDFYVNDDWIDLENGTVVIELIIDYIIGKNAFAKIQDAIDKAYYHDKIYVFQGTYNENLVIKGSRDFVKIRGIYGWEDPDPMGENIINGFAGEPVIKIEAGFVELYGFIITNNGANNNGVVVEGFGDMIYDNTIKNIGGTGVVLTSNCIECEVYHNNFIENGENALDNSQSTYGTLWYKDKEGNYWDDHPGGLKRNRRVWLRPYYIPGSANSKDRYPLINLNGEKTSQSIQQQSSPICQTQSQDSSQQSSTSQPSSTQQSTPTLKTSSISQTL